MTLLALVVSSSSIARAQSVASPSPDTLLGVGVSVDHFYGEVSQSVAIDVPSYYGIEPHLSLNYQSVDQNGFVGVGWSLGGASTIERASVGRGAPAYDANDIFMLDGQELVACASGSASPSCTTGGSHSTRIESYARVTFDAAANTWTIWQRHGTRIVYAPTVTVGSMTFRWGISSTVDTHGNTVTYNWWRDVSSSYEAYLDTVSYNGTVIHLYRESRPDQVTFATGTSLGTMAYALKTVDVQVSGSRLRTYALSYTTSTATSQSLLTKVQESGKDASVDGSGNVSGGTSLPATVYAYSASTSKPQAGGKCLPRRL